MSRNPAVTVRMSPEFRRAIGEYATDENRTPANVLLYGASLLLSKYGYWRTGGRGWRKGKTTKGGGESRATDHAVTRMVSGTVVEPR